MEVDIPQVNGFPIQPRTTFTTNGDNPGGNHVQFNSIAEVKLIEQHQSVSASASQQQSQRPKHKARRRARIPKLNIADGGEDSTVNALGGEVGKPLSPSKLKKMMDKDRHSRTGRRGIPKKGGAGGKGTWGKPTDLYDESGYLHDSRDPNYDSAEEEASYLVSPSSPHMDLDEFEKRAENIFKEYFDHGDSQEVAASLEEFNIRNIKHEIVRVLITVALEEKAANRELASVLLSDLFGHVINYRDFVMGFDAILSQLSELSLDTPDAPHIVGNFIARCVADDCLPPVYVTNHTEVTDPKMIAALKRAQLLLSMKHGIARLDNVWGVGGGQRPVMFIIGKMNLLLKEYLSSGDCEEAVRCLRELEVPHFHHELVYEAVVLVLEDGQEETARSICSLLCYMAVTTIITQDQLNTGFIRVFNDMTDIVLDAPNAYHTLSKFVEKGMEAGFVTQMIAQQVPNRGRKRYVSEGDGGAFKPPED